MADPGVVEETRDVVADDSEEDAGPDGAGGGETDRTQPDTSSSSDSEEPSLADAMRDAVAPGDGGDGQEAGGQPGDEVEGESGPGEPGARAGSEGSESGSGDSGDGTGAGGDEQLVVRNEDLAAVRQNVQGQAEANTEAVADESAVAVRKEVRRILGLDGKPGFEAESVSHIMGLARDGERVDPELEKELLAELDALGVDLGVVQLRYDSLSKEDRRQLTTFEVQQAFLRVVDRVETLATQASVSLGHRIRMFESESKDHLKLVAGVRVVLETQQKQVKELAVGFRKTMQEETEGFRKTMQEETEGFRKTMQEETEGFEEFVGRERKALSDKVKGFQMAFEGVGGHLKLCENAAREVVSKVESAGAASTAVGQEAARVMSDLQRVANSGLAVRRLALLGGVLGSAVGGFFAFVVLLLLWAVTGGS